jgi:hypothetical protein
VAFPTGCDHLGVERTEVAQVGRHDGAMLCPRERNDIGIGQRLRLVALLDRDGVMPPSAQFGSLVLPVLERVHDFLPDSGMTLTQTYLSRCKDADCDPDPDLVNRSHSVLVSAGLIADEE